MCTVSLTTQASCMSTNEDFTNREVYVLFGVKVQDTDLIKSRLNSMENTAYLELSPGCYFVASPLDTSDLAYGLLSPEFDGGKIHDGMVAMLSQAYGAFTAETMEWIRSRGAKEPSRQSRNYTPIARSWEPGTAGQLHKG